MIKEFLILLLIVFTCCVSNTVFIEDSLPLCRRSIKTFPTKVIGEYVVLNSIIENDYFDIWNKNDSPKIILATDTSIFITVEMSLSITETYVVSKTVPIIYLKTIYYSNQDRISIKDVDSIWNQNEMTVVKGDIIIDTIANLIDRDVLKKYKGQLILNKRSGKGFTPSLIKIDKSGLLEWRVINKNALVQYNNQRLNLNYQSLQQSLDNSKTIIMSNSDLRKAIKKSVFQNKYTLKKQ
jgi:hypothetical protein